MSDNIKKGQGNATHTQEQEVYSILHQKDNNALRVYRSKDS
jgi:hypothetical protein